ncbi:MAG: hypothetical protein KDK91_33500 [Gammaproteobacteria bacterium]|nr:hypothetical protein [Gammaproteobacteria bacterium]
MSGQGQPFVERYTAQTGLARAAVATTACAPGWLLPITTEHRIAIGLNEMVSLVTAPRPVQVVPFAPADCNTLFLWRSRALPMLDAARRFGLETRGPARLVAVVRFLDVQTERYEHAGISLHGAPTRIDAESAEITSSRQAVEAPAPEGPTPCPARANPLQAPESRGRTVPLIDLYALFNETWNRTAAAR